MLELIEALNNDPRRGLAEDQTRPWFFVPTDDSVQTALVHQDCDWQSVPATGQEINLRWQSCEWQGDGMFDVTDEIHPDVAESLIDAVRLVGLDVAGVDLIATDLLRPLDEQHGGILEINAEPAILVHMRPVCQSSAESIRREGLPFDRCTVAVLLSTVSHKPHPAGRGGSLASVRRDVDVELSSAKTREPLGQGVC